MLEIISNSDLETKKIAYLLSKHLKGGEVLCLYGDLGAGKTCFTSGIAKGLTCNSHISSPTFTIINEYDDGIIPLYHFDLYRINEDEFFEIGGDEYFYKKGIIIIEWPQNIKNSLPSERLEIHLNLVKNENQREITFISRGEKYENIIKKMKGVFYEDTSD